VFDLATCPLCSAAFDDAEPYRDHLEEAHGLRDDEGTATVTQLHAASAIEDDAAMSLVAEAVLSVPEAGDRPAPDGPITVIRAAAGTERYPLATRYGDVALYAPGLLMVLTALARLEADVLGLLCLLLGTVLVVLGMLLPVVLGRR
jgi:hypothetical protein